MLDTFLFFSLAFAGDPTMSGATPLLGLATVPLWASLAVFDFVVKAVGAGLLLAPYGALMSVVRPFERLPAAH